MNLNVSLFLITSICFYFVYSVNEKYYEEYFHLVRFENGRRIHESEKKYYNEICSLDSDPERLKHSLLRATICNSAIKILRNTNEDGYKDLYMDYYRFSEKPNCDYVKVWIPTEKMMVEQPVVVCPYRPSFIPMNTNYYFRPILNSKSIAVFPKVKSKIMIFNPILQPDGNIEYWDLSIIFKTQWTDYAIVPPTVFNIVVPKSYDKTQDMFNFLSNSTKQLSEKSEDKKHILNFNIIPTICKIVCRPGKYREFFYDDTMAISYEEPNVEIVTLFSEKPGEYVQFSTKVYKCYREIRTTPTTYADDYRMTAGPLNDSIILLHKTDDVLEAIELILDLNLKYINMFIRY